MDATTVIILAAVLALADWTLVADVAFLWSEIVDVCVVIGDGGVGEGVYGCGVDAHAAILGLTNVSYISIFVRICRITGTAIELPSAL